jgi:2-keto-4-pentenoate hydratase/2-oxohepta-3-ene-1,7-dioic acid hydratase in catechol pathway
VKLVRFGVAGSERPGVLVSGQRRDLSAMFPDFDRGFFEGDGLARLEALVSGGAEGLPLVPEHERWAAPLARPGKVVGIGLNYRSHALEFGVPLPAEPVLFLKAPNAVSGPYDDVPIPRGSTKLDYEVELGVVVARPARYLASAADALSYVAGYTLGHDVSERAFQNERGGQWTKGKSGDGFCPLGPWLATPDELGDVQSLGLSLDVNGERRQNGNTSDMLFGVATLIHYVSQFMSLEGGDLILTGTPGGVGHGRKPPLYLQDGDVCELASEGLGQQRQRFRKLS